MRRVVVTGMGIVSSIGNNKEEVTQSLRDARSGISFSEDFAEHGFRCHVWGAPTLNPTELVDRRAMRFLSKGGAWNHVAMQQAIDDAGLEEAEITNERTGIVMGSGGPSTRTVVDAADITRERGSPKRIGPFAVPKAMSSTASATLATWFKIHGVNYSITSACSTSAHCIGNATELIQMGKQDMVFAGGHEDLDWTMSNLFDAMGAMSSKFNDRAATASRAYDVDRDGFVIAGGAGVVVVEELEHAKARGAKIYAEIVGYGATSDGYDMVAPSGEGAVRCMRQAMATVDGPIDYINTHGTATPVGDSREVAALRETFGEDIPNLSSTKSLTGHSLGAAGVQESIYSMLMMQENFIGKSAHIEELDPEFEGVPIVRERIDDAKIDTVLSNSFGFGGTNATLVFRRFNGQVIAMSGLMKGKRGLIMGVANDHSIAWGIAQALRGQGAELAFTYQGEGFGKRVRPLAEKLGVELVIPCDVEAIETVDSTFQTLEEAWGGLDFIVHAIGFSDRNELKGLYADTTRQNFSRTMVISCFSFTEIARRAAELMNEGGSMLTLTYGGSTRVMPNYNVMGVAKAALEASVRYLAADYGPQGIRVNAISAGPIRTLAGSGVANAREMYNFQQRNSPLRRTVSIDDVGGSALYLLSDLSNGVTGEIHFVDSGYHVTSMPILEELSSRYSNGQ